jgi:ribosomal protein S12 methylthiotransferase accessory factor
MTSAAMEAIERYVAEVDDLADVRGRVDEVADRLPVPPDQLPMFRYATISPTRTYEWAAMRNLFDDREYLAPTDLVDLPTDAKAGLPYAHPWAAGSNGLASGNNLPEAICAALYEVIERDATTCWQRAHHTGAPRLVIDPATIRGPIIRGLLETLDRAGVEAQILWCPTDVGVPTCLAYILNRDPGIGVSKGYGCHLDPEIAMIRAVTEAVQSRTIFVAGARDDLLRASYETMKRSDVLVPEEFGRDALAVSVADLPDRATSSFHGDIAVLLEQLDQAGFRHVLARQLDADAFEATVARVIVPGLEPYGFQWVAAGPRARRFDPSHFIA